MRKRAVRGGPIGPAAFLSSLSIAIALGAGAGSAVGSATVPAAGATFTSAVFASGSGISHSTPAGMETVSNPDDITSLDGSVFVAFQNGVGPQGQASSTGNLDSTVVEFSRNGDELGQWDVTGKCDGLTADPQTGKLIATVNEDANSSIYLIDPAGPTVPVHYHYDRPLPSKGGTDAISVDGGMILVSASAPGTTGAPAPQRSYPAVYRVVFSSLGHVARISPLFSDEALARVATISSPYFPTGVRLALTDPDSNEVVPSYAPRFAGDFMLTSQGDQEQIFVRNPGQPSQRLSVLMLSASVDDTAWASDASGELLTTDNGANTIYGITGPFQRGQVFAAATPCDSNNAPSTCPGPGFPANYVAQLSQFTGVLTPVALAGPAPQAQGMLFLP